MTTLEAQHCINRWRRILNPWRARTASQAMHHMERSVAGMVGGMLLLVCVTYERLPAVGWFFIFLALGMLALRYRLRHARRVLHQRHS